MDPAGQSCSACHLVRVTGAHAGISCASCHGEGGTPLADPASGKHRASGCTGCHPEYASVLDGPMAKRTAEIRFVERTWGKFDREFYGRNCGSCHVAGCRDCHGEPGHRVGRPGGDACLRCHKDYYVGQEFFGRAPREDHLRYQRGQAVDGIAYLKMRPDVHAEAGMSCPDCHGMESLAQGRKSSKGCIDCHKPGRGPVEHRIEAHMRGLECYACHSAWAAQEYGTFFIRFGSLNRAGPFQVRRNDGRYARSAYLRKQDAPPLGRNRDGKVAPIRPQFIALFTDAGKTSGADVENLLLAAEWKAFFPHTVRRGVPRCEACHENPARFLLERPQDRIYDLSRDGLGMASFWTQEGQRVVDGSFYDNAAFSRMSAKSPAYQRAYVEKWKRWIESVEASSGR